MIAVSAYVLQKQGVAERQFVSVSRPGRKAWERYGIDTSGNVELSKITEHPFFKRSIEDFTGLPFVKM